MKLNFRLVLLVVAITVQFCAHGLNVLKNGDFLKVIDGNKPADWAFYPRPLPAGSSITVDTTNSYVGGKSLRIHNSNVVYTRADQPHVKVKPRTWYLISYYIKGENVTSINGGGPRIFIGPNGGYDYGLTAFGPGIAPEQKENWTFPWRKYSQKLNTGQNTEIGVTLYFHNGTGTVWFDNVQIVEITPDLEKKLEDDKARKIIGKEIIKISRVAKVRNDTPLLEELKRLERELQHWSPENTPDRFKGLPFYSFQKKVYDVMGKLLAKKYQDTPIYISEANPFKRGEWLKADLGNSVDSVLVHGLRGDIEQVALNITNCSTADQNVRFILPVGLDAKVRQVIEIEVDNTEFIDDALRLIKADDTNRYSIDIPAGMTKQLWLEITLANTPGVSSKKINFEYGDQRKTLDLRLVVDKNIFPKMMPIKTFGYAYPFIRRLSKDRIKECAKDLEKHHINTIMPRLWVVNSKSGLPLPVFDKTGKILPDSMDWSGFDEYFEKFPSCSTYIIGIDPFWRPHLFVKGIDLQKFTPQWDACLSAWLTELVKGLKKRGIGYDRFVLSGFDEPNPGHVNELAKAAKIIRRTDPMLKIYNNFHSSLNENYIKKLAGIVDIIAPEYNQLTPPVMAILNESGKELWMYRVQSKSTLPEDIRKSFWLLHRSNIKGASFWCYGDNQQEWFPKGGHSYSVIYGGDPNELTPSKRWEAFREGVEDYTLLTMLQTKDTANYREIISKYEQVELSVLRVKILHLIAN